MIRIFIALLFLSASAFAQSAGSLLSTGTQTQQIEGQKIFHCSGNQPTPFVAWSQSGATAALIAQDTNFDQPALEIRRLGEVGQTITSPAVYIRVGQETAWNDAIYLMEACPLTSGDNAIVMWGNASMCVPGGIYSGHSKTDMGTLSVHARNRALVGADGVTNMLTWGGNTVSMPAATVTGTLNLGSNIVITGIIPAANIGFGIAPAKITGTAVTLAGSETLTNKTLVAPTISNPIGLTKANVGLGNVDNTSDASKPVSTAQQTALNGKANSAVRITAGSGLVGGGDLTVNRTVSINFASTNTWTGGQTFSNITVSGTSQLGSAPVGSISSNYTLSASDAGKVLRVTAAATITLPSGLPVGFNVEIIQEGTGQVTFAAGSGVTLRQRQNFTKTAGQWAAASLIVNTSNSYVLAGDLSN